MKAHAIIPKKINLSVTLVALQVVSIVGAAIFLFTSRFYSMTVIPAILLLGLAVFLSCYSRYRLFSILLIGLFTSLILSLRFDYLPWGDPWFEFEMIQRILTYQSIDLWVYPAQLPVIHVIITTFTLFTGINPLDLLKFIIPPLSVIGLYAVYRITKDVSTSTKSAFFAGLLLLCGTPYLHWTTQGVRETAGIALFALAIFVSIAAIQSQKKSYLFISLLLVVGLILAHHLSAMIFLFVWIAVSLTYLYLICDMNRIQMTSIFSLVISLTATISIIIWVTGHPMSGYSSFSGFLNKIFFSEYGIPLFILSLFLLCLLPVKIPKKILELRSAVSRILVRRNLIYAVFLIGTVVSSGIVLNFIMGKSTFVLNYPLPMFFNGICMIILSLVGLYYFLETDRLHVLAWIAVLAFLLILSMSNVVPFIDPLRFMEFLYIPLAIIAAFGLARIAESLGSKCIFSIFLTAVILISIITSFPSVVFWGQSFEQGHPLYDNRNYVISHEITEISAITWLDRAGAEGIAGTDSYVGYPARAILFQDPVSIDTLYSFIRPEGYPHSAYTNSENRYLIIVSRMNEYMEFGAQWLKEKKPMDEKDLKKINYDCNRLYDNGNARIFLFSTSCCWVPPE